MFLNGFKGHQNDCVDASYINKIKFEVSFFVKAVDFYTINRMYFGIGKRKSELTGQRHHLILFLKYERSRNRANR